MSRPHAPEEMNDRHIGTRLGQIGTKTARNMGTETNRHQTLDKSAHWKNVNVFLCLFYI